MRPSDITIYYIASRDSDTFKSNKELPPLWICCSEPKARTVHLSEFIYTIFERKVKVLQMKVFGIFLTKYCLVSLLAFYF